MSNLDRNVIYTYKLQTNFAEVSAEAGTDIEQTQADVDRLQTSMDALGTSTEEAKKKLKATKDEVALTAMTLTAMASAVNGVTNGLIQLGIVSGEDAEAIRNVNAGFQVMIGLATGLKSWCWCRRC